MIINKYMTIIFDNFQKAKQETTSFNLQSSLIFWKLNRSLMEWEKYMSSLVIDMIFISLICFIHLENINLTNDFCLIRLSYINEGILNDLIIWKYYNLFFLLLYETLQTTIIDTKLKQIKHNWFFFFSFLWYLLPRVPESKLLPQIKQSGLWCVYKMNYKRF